MTKREKTEKFRQHKKDHDEALRAYRKKYYREHQEEVIAYRKAHKEKTSLYNKQYKKDNPWVRAYDRANSRCNNVNRKSYKTYGGRGIELHMTLADFKYLWFRDKAYNMDQPSISRYDHTKNYEIDNCCYEELSIHRERDNMTRKSRSKVLQ